MKKILLLAIGSISLVVSNAQSVGIGTTTPFRLSKLHVKGLNTDSTYAAIFDGDTLGVAIQAVRGTVNIGPYGSNTRFFAATEQGSTLSIDSVAPIFGYAVNPPSALMGGVFGTMNGDVGVGVQGVALGLDYAGFFSDQYLDAGVYGSGTIGTLGLGGIGINGMGNTFGVYAEIIDLSETPPETQYALYASSEGGTALTKYAGFFEGDVTVTGELAKGSGTFKIDDPIDPANKYLYHSFVESPDMMNIYNGNITTDANGIAQVTMPAYFDALNKDFRYQLTSIGTFAQAIVKEEINGTRFTIQTSQPNVKVSWQVTGVRKDKFAEAHRVKVEVEKEPWNKGLYLHAQEFGLDKTKSIGNSLSQIRPTTMKPSLNSSLKSQLKLKTGQTRQTYKAPLLKFNLNSN